MSRKCDHETVSADNSPSDSWLAIGLDLTLVSTAEGGRAVIIPLTDAHMMEWRLLGRGDKLRMFEGPRLCGYATVRWAENTSLPVPVTDQARFRASAGSSDDLPRPT